MAISISSRTLGRVLFTSIGLSISFVVGCTRQGEATESRTVATFSSGTEAERYFPLRDGRTYAYEVKVGEEAAAHQWLITAKRTEDNAGELRTPTGAKKIQYRNDGVYLPDKSAYLLKFPLSVGATWPGEHGGTTRVLAINAVVDTKAGKFSGCVQTVEEVAAEGATFLTTFCPEVGIAVLEAASNAGHEEAILRSLGAEAELLSKGAPRQP